MNVVTRLREYTGRYRKDEARAASCGGYGIGEIYFTRINKKTYSKSVRLSIGGNKPTIVD